MRRGGERERGRREKGRGKGKENLVTQILMTALMHSYTG